MKRTRHTAEQIIRKLKTAEQLIAQGKTVADVCRAIFFGMVRLVEVGLKPGSLACPPPATSAAGAAEPSQ